MAIIARCDRSMAALHPGVIMVLHDMAIRASSGIVSEIRAAFGVNEGISANSHRQTYDGSDNRSSNGACPHSQRRLYQFGNRRKLGIARRNASVPGAAVIVRDKAMPPNRRNLSDDRPGTRRLQPQRDATPAGRTARHGYAASSPSTITLL